MTERCPRSFYLRPTRRVARELLGKILCLRRGRKVLRARIVETEAYLGLSDPAAHSYGGHKTSRTLNLYREGGHSYVYLIYGMYDCFNVVAGAGHRPEAVLVRGVEPLSGFGALNPSTGLPWTSRRILQTNGPGKLCKAMGLTRKHNGLDLVTSSELWIEDDGFKASRSLVAAVPRVGIDYAEHAVEWPLRFYIKGNVFVSRA